MASSPSTGTNSSGSSSLRNSTEDNLPIIQQQISITDVRKRKRMLSNRESARRSRMRKKKLLDDLAAQVVNLKAENYKILANINFATQMCLDVESENSVLRAQVSELNHRLKALNDIVNSVNSSNNFSDIANARFDHHHQKIDVYEHFDGFIGGDDYDDLLMSSYCNLMHGDYTYTQQPVMASGGVFMC